MTDEEHHARAMLMGMRYNKMAGYYFSLKGERVFQRLDAGTLEPIGIDEANTRMKAAYARDNHSHD